MRARFVFACATLVLVGCREGGLTGRRTVGAETQATAASSLTTRRLWSGPGVDSLGSPSPDGKFISFVDWETGGLALREVATGRTHSLVTTQGDLTEWAYFSVFSRDGKRLAYSFYGGDDVFYLRDLGMDGSTPHTLFGRTEAREIIPMDWSPDGTQILAAVRWKDSTSQILLVDSDSGATRVLKTLGWQVPSKLAFSPDARYIAYDFSRDDTSTKRDIAILATDGSTDTPVATHDADDRVLGWSPDGRIFLSSDRDGSQSVWTMLVTDGQPAADPVRLAVDLWRLERALGFDKNGVFYYGVTPTVADLYVATIDPSSLKVTASPQPVSAGGGGTHGPGAWSPDGRLLAFLVSEAAVSINFSSVIIRSLETGDQRVLKPRLMQLRSVQWFPDGRSLLVGGVDFKGRAGFHRVDPQSGAVTALRLRAPDGPTTFGPSLSPDGATLYFRTFTDRKSEISLVIARDLISGAEREVHRIPGRIGFPSLSPDGKQLALPVSRRTSVPIVPVTGGEPRTIVPLPDGYTAALNRGPVVWGPNDTLILPLTNAKQETEVWSLPINGGGAQRLDLNLPAMTQLQLHPDGRRLLFRAGEVTSEIWAMNPS